MRTPTGIALFSSSKNQGNGQSPLFVEENAVEEDEREERGTRTYGDSSKSKRRFRVGEEEKEEEKGDEEERGARTYGVS